MHNSLDGVGVGVGVGEGVVTHRSSVFSVTRGKWWVNCPLYLGICITLGLMSPTSVVCCHNKLWYAYLTSFQNFLETDGSQK